MINLVLNGKMKIQGKELEFNNLEVNIEQTKELEENFFNPFTEEDIYLEEDESYMDENEDDCDCDLCSFINPYEENIDNEEEINPSTMKSNQSKIDEIILETFQEALLKKLKEESYKEKLEKVRSSLNLTSEEETLNSEVENENNDAKINQFNKELSKAVIDAKLRDVFKNLSEAIVDSDTDLISKKYDIKYSTSPKANIFGVPVKIKLADQDKIEDFINHFNK